MGGVPEPAFFELIEVKITNKVTFSVAVHCKKSSWNHSLPWKCFHVSGGNLHCMEGGHASMEIITSI
jgi:hypothetical protein